MTDCRKELGNQGWLLEALEEHIAQAQEWQHRSKFALLRYWYIAFVAKTHFATRATNFCQLIKICYASVAHPMSEVAVRLIWSHTGSGA